MEILEEKIKEFLKIETGYGYGYGDGSGYGYGDGSGYGDGYGDGDGSGYGDGDGSGYGYGYGYGDGDGSGYGYGYGDGSGYGYGDGSGYGIKSINGKNVYLVDRVQTIITQVRNNIAKGFILNKDLSLELCYVVKGHNLFAHGTTSKSAFQALQEKIFENLDPDEVIEEFRKKFKKDAKYKGEEFYTWHHILTGSCEMGRNSFVRNHDIDLAEKFTVEEFIELCENDYGGEIIKRLKEYY